MLNQQQLRHQMHLQNATIKLLKAPPMVNQLAMDAQRNQTANQEPKSMLLAKTRQNQVVRDQDEKPQITSLFRFSRNAKQCSSPAI